MVRRIKADIDRITKSVINRFFHFLAAWGDDTASGFADPKSGFDGEEDGFDTFLAMSAPPVVR